MGVVVLLGFKIAGMVLDTPYHRLWVHAMPWVSWLGREDEFPEGSAFHMVVPGVQAVSFVMWMSNEFLFWPYLFCWAMDMTTSIEAQGYGDDKDLGIGDMGWVFAVYYPTTLVLGFKQATFVWRVLDRVLDRAFVSPGPFLSSVWGLAFCQLSVALLIRRGWSAAAFRPLALVLLHPPLFLILTICGAMGRSLVEGTFWVLKDIFKGILTCLYSPYLWMVVTLLGLGMWAWFRFRGLSAGYGARRVDAV